MSKGKAAPLTLKPWYSLHEFAAMTCETYRTTLSRATRGAIPVAKIDGRTRVPLADLQDRMPVLWESIVLAAQVREMTGRPDIRPLYRQSAYAEMTGEKIATMKQRVHRGRVTVLRLGGRSYVPLVALRDSHPSLWASLLSVASTLRTASRHGKR